jgi:hypothetical protein
MPFRDHLPFFVFVVSQESFGDKIQSSAKQPNGVLVKALLVVLVLSIPFTKDWVALIVSLQDCIAREAGRIYNQF